MSAVGFQYDELTAADDASIAATRERIFACPCGDGVWASVQTGEVYRGNGGNERSQWWLQSQGPWVRVEKDEGHDRIQQHLARAQAAYETLRSDLAKLIGADL